MKQEQAAEQEAVEVKRSGPADKHLKRMDMDETDTEEIKRPLYLPLPPLLCIDALRL